MKHLSTFSRSTVLHGADNPTQFAGKYSGLLHVTRLPRLNSLVAPLQDATVFGFTAKRKRLYIEQLHIPPADDAPAGDGSAASTSSVSVPGMLCVPTKASKLEF